MKWWRCIFWHLLPVTVSRGWVGWSKVTWFLWCSVSKSILFTQCVYLHMYVSLFIRNKTSIFLPWISQIMNLNSPKPPIYTSTPTPVFIRWSQSLKRCLLASCSFLFDLLRELDALLRPFLSSNASLSLWVPSLSFPSGHFILNIISSIYLTFYI